MNERIRELWAQCVIKHSKTPMNWQDVADEFAELIVRECINQVSDLMDYTEYTDSHFNAVELKALRDARRVIQEHFGVEETKGWICPRCGVDRTKTVCPQEYQATIEGKCPMFGVTQ